MSSDSYDKHETYRSASYTAAEDPVVKARLLDERTRRVTSFRDEVEERSSKPRPKRDPRESYDERFVRKAITKPVTGVSRVYVVLIDNSGSNRAIANHFRNSTNYLRVNLNLIDPEAQFLFNYVSDHCDRNLWWQPIDFVKPDAEGEKILASTLFHVDDASGGDEPEAYECSLRDACQIDFGSVKERHLILITDVVGHGMGMFEDGGCPNQQDWRKSLDLVEKTYTTFEVIGCGVSKDVAELQKQFIVHSHPEELAMNFVSLAYIKESQYRLGIVLNAFLLLVARHRGLQNTEGFLARLYEKWVSDPIFGSDTDRKAKEAILRFAKYIPAQSKAKIDMMSRLLVTSTEEVERLMKEGAVFI